MNTIVENLTGMNTLTDQVVAMDLLIAAKSGIKDYALAITETASPEVRNTLRTHLNQGIDFHEKLTKYMQSKGWYNAYDIENQISMDIRNAQTALNIPE